MTRKLTASDRTALIRLAGVLPKGSAERRTLLARLKGGVNLDFTHRLDGLSVRLKFKGTAGKLKVTGRMHPFFLGLDPLDWETVDNSITINREDKPGKEIPYKVRRAVVDEILRYMKSTFKKELSGK